MKTALVLGAGGFIGSHLVKKLKQEGFWVRGVDLKHPEYWKTFADDFQILDLRNLLNVSKIMLSPFQKDEDDEENSFDEVYQLAADMGGAGYIFTGENDANVMHNSSLINLNVVHEATIKKVKRIFYSSSACIYPEHNQMDPNNPNCEESSAYPANPDSDYGWEKLFSERLYLSFHRNYKLDVRIARYHNVFGPYGTWKGGKEKSPAAMCRKVCEAKPGETIEVWGDGSQTRSFLYIDECIQATLKFMRQNEFSGPINIGSEEMISINKLAEMALEISDKKGICSIKNLYGQEFIDKYGHNCPIGVKGRKSDNKLFRKKMGWEPNQPLIEGMKKTFKWINEQYEK